MHRKRGRVRGYLVGLRCHQWVGASSPQPTILIACPPSASTQPILSSEAPHPATMFSAKAELAVVRQTYTVSRSPNRAGDPANLKVGKP
eukprot:570096-Rhodomonas_salina.1